MTDIEKKALALVNEVCVERGLIGGWDKHTRETHVSIETLCRAIEQHEAFKREVSDAVEKTANAVYSDSSLIVRSQMKRFIIAKPDPLVEVLQEISGEGGYDNYDHYAYRLQSAIEARGGRIVWEGE